MADKNKLYQLICTQSSLLIKPTLQVAVDEQLRLFTGAYANKIMMPSKPAGEGCHSYIIADSNSRLPLWYSIEGKGKLNYEVDTLTGYGKIAASLAEPFDNVTLFVDNLNCTYQMCIYLQSKNIECVGTVRLNYLPPSLKILFNEFKKKNV